MEGAVTGDMGDPGGRLPGAIAAACLFVGCAGAPPRAPHPAPAAVEPQAGASPAAFANRIVSEARGLLGTPYHRGGADPAGMDCSGLVSLVFARAGVATPRTALAQQQAAMRIELDQLQPGDLVFFRLPDPHVGIYLGAWEFIHAPGTGRTVTIARLDEPHFLRGFAGGGRFRP
jgi:cell wall-associated NlpC family hydrolase